VGFEGARYVYYETASLGLPQTTPVDELFRFAPRKPRVIRLWDKNAVRHRQEEPSGSGKHADRLLERQVPGFRIRTDDAEVEQIRWRK
jgi:hypothetical protein